MTITGGDVMTYLLPEGGWSIHGEDFDTVIFDKGVKTITKAEFEAGFDSYAVWKTNQDAINSAAKLALLNRLGITEAEAKLLLS